MLSNDPYLTGPHNDAVYRAAQLRDDERNSRFDWQQIQRAKSVQSRGAQHQLDVPRRVEVRRATLVATL